MCCFGGYGTHTLTTSREAEAPPPPLNDYICISYEQMNSLALRPRSVHVLLRRVWNTHTHHIRGGGGPPPPLNEYICISYEQMNSFVLRPRCVHVLLWRVWSTHTYHIMGGGGPAAPPERIYLQLL